ncbi:5824_t:CDS:2 [Funneliformis caledonium]|uniref:5824_t:CDS:1 n=1 Tax=Funneliformis caledonium TaxID=1117310 RepID=A0A9N9GR47_9GLOM|nr:5824_t:CDS:2 [Funneliformis caledonium]
MSWVMRRIRLCKVVIAKREDNKESEKESLTKHPEKYSHEDDFPFCDAKCQFYECFCTLPHRHTQLHDIKHRNMIPNQFSCSGNVQVLKKQQEFAKCDTNVPRKHSQGSSNAQIKSFYGHVKIQIREKLPLSYCFVLDRSESMSSNDMKPSPWTFIFKEMKANNNNRLSIPIYGNTSSTQENQNQFSPPLRNSISLILFDHNVIVPLENRNLTESGALLKQWWWKEFRSPNGFNLFLF